MMSDVVSEGFGITIDPQMNPMDMAANMSLRDRMAIQAMSLRWANWEVGIDVNGFASTQDLAALAANCYRVADALLAERAK
jgi:hypothetical protein